MLLHVEQADGLQPFLRNELEVPAQTVAVGVVVAVARVVLVVLVVYNQ